MSVKSSCRVANFLLFLLVIARDVSAGYTGFVSPSAWSRDNCDYCTYQEWERFADHLPAPPLSPPDAGGPWSDPPLPPTQDVHDSSGLSFLTGGGNIYSFSGPTDLHVLVPGHAVGNSGWTTLVLQTTTLGTPVDLSSVRVVVDNQSYTPADQALLRTIPLGGFGGEQQDRWFEFHVPGNAGSYELRFNALGSSMSLDKVAVDTIWTAAAAPIDLANPTIPEPTTSTLLVLSCVAAVGWRRLRRWKGGSRELTAA